MGLPRLAAPIASGALRRPINVIDFHAGTISGGGAGHAASFAFQKTQSVIASGLLPT